MPLGIVNDNDFDKELGDSIVPDSIESPETETPVSGEVVIPKESGRGQGKSNVPDSIRKFIGEDYAIEGRASGVELAKALGLSHQSAEAYGNGATSLATYNKPTDILDHINNKKTRIVKRASSKLMKALDNITDDKLVLAKPSDLAGIARNLSGVIKDMEPENKNPMGGPNIQFVMFAPKLIAEEKFETMTVNE